VHLPAGGFAQMPCTALRFEEVEELWSDFQDVVGALYHEPTVVAKMEGKLKRGFTESAMRSGLALKSWLDQFVKAGRLSLKHMEGSKMMFSAAWCTFLMLLPRDAVPDQEFDQTGAAPESPSTTIATQAAKNKATSVRKTVDMGKEKAVGKEGGGAGGRSSSGHKRCMHNREERNCKECGGSGICQHQRQRRNCKECGGTSICKHGTQRNRCKECEGTSICRHKREKHTCRECGGSGICVHNKRKARCKECGGKSICEHDRRRSRCRDCGGKEICEHGKLKHTCRTCGGSGICEHLRVKRHCRECRLAEAIAQLKNTGTENTGTENTGTVAPVPPEMPVLHTLHAPQAVHAPITLDTSLALHASLAQHHLLTQHHVFNQHHILNPAPPP